MEFNKFNYIGSKYKLLPKIIEKIEKKIDKPLTDMTIGDLFSGTAICSYNFRQLGNTVISNDYEYYGYVIARAFTKSVYTENIEKVLKVLQNAEPTEGLITKNYSPRGDRMFFTEKNAMKLDSIRITLNELKESKKIDEDEYYYLLTCVLLAADKVANITSVYGAYLKKFKKPALNDIKLTTIHKITKKNDKALVYNNNINDIISKDKYDIVYLDPPYNERQYSKNYHVLNYIALYDNLKIKGVTGIIENSNISLYCRKSEIAKQLDHLCANVNTKWLFMSYNNEGLLDHQKIIEIMGKYGSVSVEEMEYKRFKSNNNGEQANSVIEYLFCLLKN
jgi:adenine-specific DNA-methyltransferase